MHQNVAQIGLRFSNTTITKDLALKIQAVVFVSFCRTPQKSPNINHLVPWAVFIKSFLMECLASHLLALIGTGLNHRYLSLRSLFYKYLSQRMVCMIVCVSAPVMISSLFVLP